MVKFIAVCHSRGNDAMQKRLALFCVRWCRRSVDRSRRRRAGAACVNGRLLLLEANRCFLCAERRLSMLGWRRTVCRHCSATSANSLAVRSSRSFTRQSYCMHTRLLSINDASFPLYPQSPIRRPLYVLAPTWRAYGVLNQSSSYPPPTKGICDSVKSSRHVIRCYDDPGVRCCCTSRVGRCIGDTTIYVGCLRTQRTSMYYGVILLRRAARWRAVPHQFTRNSMNYQNIMSACRRRLYCRCCRRRRRRRFTLIECTVCSVCRSV